MSKPANRGDGDHSERGPLDGPKSSAPEEGDAGPRPDWLLTAAHPVEAFKPSSPSSPTRSRMVGDELELPGSPDPAAKPMLRRPANVPPRMAGPPRLEPPPPVATPAPKGIEGLQVENHALPAVSETGDNMAGLVGPETPKDAPAPALAQRPDQLGLDRQTLLQAAIVREQVLAESTGTESAAAAVAKRDEDPFGHATQRPAGETGAWKAAASSIPTLGRAADDGDDDDAITAAEDEWDEPREAPATSRGAATRTAPTAKTQATPLAGYAQALQKFLSVLWPRLRSRTAIVAGIGGGLVVLAVTLAVSARPREQFMRVHEVLMHAEQLDGQEVRLRGVIGQTFPVGEGHTFYLHDGEDMIVVFTRVRTPVEREEVRVVGTVSTGFLDGKPRPVVFESLIASK
jgi:hypothetical protein